MKTILVTGITGFIAKHVTLELLNRGYRVRGTLRDAAKGVELKSLFADLGCDPSNLEFAELDLLKEAGLPVKFQIGEPWWWIMPDGRI